MKKEQLEKMANSDHDELSKAAKALLQKKGKITITTEQLKADLEERMQEYITINQAVSELSGETETSLLEAIHKGKLKAVIKREDLKAYLNKQNIVVIYK